MSPSRINVIFAIIITCVYGHDITKTSLTFVIDDTGSMSEEISQVKDSVNSIFDTVVSSKNSPIENFILVTFNDPDSWYHRDVNLLTVTQDRYEFKSALASINVDGGGDCPEYAMKGIKLALETSLPRSLVYVFTDASAKDYKNYEEIRSLAQKKNIQVTFLLTGDCDGRAEPAYQVYHQLADTTGGEVFNLMKSDIKEVLDYIKQNIKDITYTIVSKKFPPGYGHEVEIPIDSKTKSKVISVTGKRPEISVKNPDGIDVPLKSIVDKTELKIVSLPETKPGVHKATVGSMTNTSVKVTGSSTISFQHGFSSFVPSSLDDTATRPAPVGNAYLSIKLHGDKVILEKAKIIDMSGNVIIELPLLLIDEKTKFYVTELFDPPRTTFRIEVHGYDEEDKSPLKRVSATPIERQNPKHEIVYQVAPSVTIEGGPTITTKYNKKLELKCKVHGYPKPDIIWQQKGTKITLPATVSTIEVPYDYISILNIERATKNGTFECIATSPLGASINYVEVRIPEYFNVVESPKDVINVKYDDVERIVCKVEAEPPAIITWYKDGNVLFGNDNIQIASDMTTITIKHMTLETQGKYICEARNVVHRKLFNSNVIVYGLMKPTINKTDEEVRVLKGNDAKLTCQIIEGTPKPRIQWYFQREDAEKFIELSETGEVLHLVNVSIDYVGTYKCNATNVMGSALYALDLIVEYPPIIKDDKVKIKRVNDGNKITLPCDVDAVPKASVKWLKDESRLESRKNIRMTTDHSLKFREISVSDSGNYTCVANNKFGSSKKTVYVDVIVPVNIDVPKVTNIEIMVGRSILLECHADGYPKPEVVWVYNEFDAKRPPKSLRPNYTPTSLGLRKIQLKDQGFYTCVASNVGGSTNITYVVKVNAPPVIENLYPDRTFRTVNGDVALIIQCKATGSPKPTIVWKKDDLNIASGSEWYDIENGTLIIKNIDKKSQGSYLCVAQNKIGIDTMVYEVVVNDYPIPGTYISTKYIAENEKDAHIQCDVPHKKTDSLRWYKDYSLISEGELTLHNVKRKDEGVYSCRVSNSTKSLSDHVKLKVGQKPFFVSEEPEFIDFVLGDYVPLICEAQGEPELKVSWKHNGKEVDVTDMFYDLEMMFDNRGTYTCTVSNQLGSIQRNFKIVTQDCIFETKKDFVNEKQPLMLSPSLTWPSFQILDDYMTIQKSELFYLHCPNGFSKFPTYYATAFCEGETKVKVNGNVYEYDEIKCNEEVEVTTTSNGTSCLPGNTEKIQVGYQVISRFLKVYEVCLDKDNNIPLYTKHQLTYEQFGVTMNMTEWSQNGLPFIDFETIYDCRNQANEIPALRVDNPHGCCYDRRQLINPKDLKPIVPITAAYTYLNVVPHWSTCNSKNWADVEERVRNLAKSVENGLTVITGTAKPRRESIHTEDILLDDRNGRKQPVAPYLWKVVQDPISSKSLAIIQVNVPNLTPEAAPHHVYCKDICNAIEWMKGTDWHNVEDGYTYCCSILSFEAAFNFYKQFSRDKTGILNNVAIPEYTYSI